MRQRLMSCSVNFAGSHLNGSEGIERAQREEEQRRQFPGDHGGGDKGQTRRRMRAGGRWDGAR